MLSNQCSLKFDDLIYKAPQTSQSTINIIMSQSIKVFITGATGYIGGEVLYQLTQDKQSPYEISALVRSEAKAKTIAPLEVEPVIGSLSDAKLIEEKVKESDVIINMADIYDPVSANIIKKALVEKRSPTILIHTSGADVLQDGLSPLFGPSDKVYGDISNIDEINELDNSQPHREADKIILSIEELNPEFVKTVIICPPNIFGFGRGLGNTISAQVPVLVTLALANKQPVTVYSGRSLWNQIHVQDLGALYLLLLEKLLKFPEAVATGKKGYYFAEDGSAISWREKSEKVGQLLKEKGLVEKAEIAELAPQQIVDLFGGMDIIPYVIGTNARCKAELARALGWKPTHSSDDDFWSDVAYVVEYVTATV